MCTAEAGAALFSSDDEDGDGALDDDFGGDLGELSGGDSELDADEDMGGSATDDDSMSEGSQGGEEDDSDAETKVERQSRKLDMLKCAALPAVHRSHPCPQCWAAPCSEPKWAVRIGLTPHSTRVSAPTMHTMGCSRGGGSTWGCWGEGRDWHCGSHACGWRRRSAGRMGGTHLTGCTLLVQH